MTDLVTGLDLGGAHLKAAQVDGTGRVVAALQVPCALWLGLDRLGHALSEVRARLRPSPRIALTMTGELADLFPDRPCGVAALVRAADTVWPQAELLVWAGCLGFVTPAEAVGRAAGVASANWLATGYLAAHRLGEGLLIDVGSTTTDLLVLAGGTPRPAGLTDRERLASGELVYLGLTRTPVMALAAEVPFRGQRVGVMNELFATAADVHRLLGQLPEDADQHPAADRGPKTIEASARRLARMVGADLADGDMADWCRLAAWLAQMQLRRIEDAMALQCSRSLIGAAAPVIGAGCGQFLVERLAGASGRPYRDFAGLITAEPDAAGRTAMCAPAVAVALLLHGVDRALG